MQPVWTGIEAEYASPTVTLVGAVMTGVSGTASMVMLAVPGVLAVPAALATTQPSWTVPEAPAVKLIPV